MKPTIQNVTLPAKQQFIAYYRVSTDRQGASGLGLDAQREAVKNHIGGEGLLLAEFTEIESGKKHTNRPQLLAALAECKRRRAKLVIAKLDRLGRNVAFISALMESEVDFVCCDNPHATRLMIHMLAAFAEHEREMISQRTKAALSAAKKRGVKLGSPTAAETITAARAARNIKPTPPAVIQIMRDEQQRGATLRGIARHLNELKLRSPRGCQWHAKTVRAVLNRPARMGHAAA